MLPASGSPPLGCDGDGEGAAKRVLCVSPWRSCQERRSALLKPVSLTKRFCSWCLQPPLGRSRLDRQRGCLVELGRPRAPGPEPGPCLVAYDSEEVAHLPFWSLLKELTDLWTPQVLLGLCWRIQNHTDVLFASLKPEVSNSLFLGGKLRHAASLLLMGLTVHKSLGALSIVLWLVRNTAPQTA